MGMTLNALDSLEVWVTEGAAADSTQERGSWVGVPREQREAWGYGCT